MEPFKSTGRVAVEWCYSEMHRQNPSEFFLRPQEAFFFLFLAAGHIAVRPFAAADGEQVLPLALGSLNLGVARGQTVISSSTSQGKTLSRPDDLGLLKEVETKKSSAPTRFRCARAHPHPHMHKHAYVSDTLVGVQVLMRMPITARLTEHRGSVIMLPKTQLAASVDAYGPVAS